MKQIKLSPLQLGLITLATVVLARLLTLGFYPLMDTTEARYGEMARMMVETGNWLTPMFNYGVPFWGKPPLHTWMSASSIAVFTNNEFFMRFPHWLAAMVTIAICAAFARTLKFSALNTAIILGSIGVFSIAAGAVMTDMALALSLTIAFIGFYLGWFHEKKWSYLGFLGLTLGMLAKGPVTLVIFAIGAGLWMFWEYGVIKCWRELGTRIPLVSGFALFIVTSAPWYIMAEQATPGFLEYFFVGEHWKRFVESGWSGDLYGSAHSRARGMIWVYFVSAALPWTLFIPQALYRTYKQHGARLDTQTRFLLCWMLSPLVLFTFSGNILPAYVLPAAPALALLIAKTRRESDQKIVHRVALVIPVLLMIALVYLSLGFKDERSDKLLLAERELELSTYYLHTDSFSSRYYSNGTVISINSLDDIDTSEDFYLVQPKDRKLDALLVDACSQLSFTKRRAIYLCQKSPTNS